MGLHESNNEQANVINQELISKLKNMQNVIYILQSSNDRISV